jgi:hypothetical protein
MVLGTNKTAGDLCCASLFRPACRVSKSSYNVLVVGDSIYNSTRLPVGEIKVRHRKNRLRFGPLLAAAAPASDCTAAAAGSIHQNLASGAEMGETGKPFFFVYNVENKTCAPQFFIAGRNFLLVCCFRRLDVDTLQPAVNRLFGAEQFQEKREKKKEDL